jgi:ribosomal protein S18 acetylase RimI-like enzyme
MSGMSDMSGMNGMNGGGVDEKTTRRALLDALAAIAPEADLAALAPDRPLREQLELDSLDWVNLLAALPVAAGDDAAARPPPGPRATLDDLVRWAGGTPAAAPSSALDAVQLRPLGAADAPLEDAFVRALSDDSRYKRFMSGLPALSPAKLAALTDVDQVQHVALAAVTRDGDAETMVGAARYIVDADGHGGEFAIAVADAWQRSGLAGRLMHALMARARAQGLTRLWGVVLASNRPMLHFVRQLGFRLGHEPEDPHTVRAEREL